MGRYSVKVTSGRFEIFFSGAAEGQERDDHCAGPCSEKDFQRIRHLSDHRLLLNIAGSPSFKCTTNL